jgi:hypothetical protein
MADISNASAAKQDTSLLMPIRSSAFSSAPAIAWPAVLPPHAPTAAAAI